MARCVLLLLACVVAAATAETVTIPGLGDVNGVTSKTAWTGRTVYEYRGIRYAQAPIGSRRFKEPVAEVAWTTPYDATTYKQACPQPSASRLGALAAMLTPDDSAVYEQSTSAARADDPEDCLTLDVYTPTTDASRKLPVVVYIHGGFFLAGSSAVHKPGFLLEHDVVMVSIQYRLGPLGWLYLDHEEAPGNMGLMDQIMALKWVQDNIAAFGGDPAKVTVGGFSAGGGSVSLLMLSPEADGHFHKVLNQGGSALGHWAIDETVGVADSKRVAELAGCSQPEIVEISGCLRGKTPDAVIDAYLKYSAEQREAGMLGTGGCMPVIQNPEGTYRKVITERPLVTLYDGTYEGRPMLTGVNKHEGIFVMDYVEREFLIPNDYIENEDFLKNHLIQALLNAVHVKENSLTFADAVTKRYFNETQLGDYKAMILGLIDMCGSEFLKSPWHRQCDLHSLENDVYAYAWHYYGKYSLMQNSNITLPIEGGVTHGDDTLFMFPNQKFPLDDYEKNIAKRFVQALANFIILGNPTPEDKPVSGLPRWEKFARPDGFYMNFYDESTLESNFKETLTIAADEGIRKRNSAAIAAASPLVLLLLALYSLLQ